jgi:UDP-glucuronate 4-epimerase
LSKTVLVTGAAGFIGSHTAQALLVRGDAVVGLDNLNDYYDPARKRSNLEEVRCITQHTSRFLFIEGDVRDQTLVSRLFADHPFDTIVHLAAMAGARVSIDDPHLYYDINLIGTLNLLDAARDHDVGSFTHASTSSVYGNTLQIPLVETDICDRPLAPYPASKRAAEMLGFTYHHLYKQDFTVLRFFTAMTLEADPT